METKQTHDDYENQNVTTTKTTRDDYKKPYVTTKKIEQPPVESAVYSIMGVCVSLSNVR